MHSCQFTWVAQPGWYNQVVQSPSNSPILLAFVADLSASTRIDNACQALGYEVQVIESMNGQPDLQSTLKERVTRLRPALIIFDMNNEQIPWKAAISLLQSDPAIRRIPLICYGSHIAESQIQTAQDTGVQAVYEQAYFFSSLPKLVQKHARRVDQAALAEACLTPLALEAIQGLELFNRGEYFEAHELLEEAWKQDQGPARELYRAILQAAVAYLQIERGNYNGAVKMFLRLRQWIDPLPERCRGVDVASLRRDTMSAYTRLLILGPDNIHSFDRSLFKSVIYQNSLINKRIN